MRANKPRFVYKFIQLKSRLNIYKLIFFTDKTYTRDICSENGVKHRSRAQNKLNNFLQKHIRIYLDYSTFFFFGVNLIQSENRPNK